MQLEVANRELLLGGRIHTAGDVARFLSRTGAMPRGLSFPPREPDAPAEGPALWHANRHGYFGRTYFEEDLKPTWDESVPER
jgi:hypothetical protein